MTEFHKILFSYICEALYNSYYINALCEKDLMAFIILPGRYISFPHKIPVHYAWRYIIKRANLSTNYIVMEISHLIHLIK